MQTGRTLGTAPEGTSIFGLRSYARHPSARDAALFVLVAVGYGAGYKLAQEWFSAADQGASFFPPAGLTLATLVLVRRRSWPIVLAAAAAAEVTLDLWNGTWLVACLGYALANTAEPLVGATLLLAAAARPDLRRTRDLTAFLVCAVALAPVVGGVIAATTFVFVDDHSGWFRFALEWWSGDGLGVLVVGGAMLALRPWPPVSRHRGVEGLVIGACAVAATEAVFAFGWFPFVYVPIALLVVLAFRVGTAGVAVTAAAAAFVAAGGTAEADEFWTSIDISPANRILYLQLAIGVIVAAVLALAAEIAERERMAEELARADALRVAAHAAAEDDALLAAVGEVLERATATRERARDIVAALVAARAELAVIHGLAEDDRPRVLAEAPDGPGAAIEIDRDHVLDLVRVASRRGEAVADSGGGLDLVAVPLRARDRTLGILTVGASTERGTITRALARRIAIRVALALDNAMLYEQEREVSHSLQIGLLGGEPAGDPSTAIASAYRPGTATLEVGGDWHDAFTLRDGNLAMVVGDVVGHGLEAAVAMGQLRGAVRALAPLGTPAQVLDGLDLFVEQSPTAAMATLAYAELDLETGTITYACAGHPPPLLVPAKGEPRLLWDGRSTPLGSSFIRNRDEAFDRLEPGDTIVLYTDGLVERRADGIGRGLEALVAAARHGARSDPAALVDHMLSSLLDGEEQEDDVCMLAVVRAAPVLRFVHELPASPIAVAEMRRALGRWLDEIGLEPLRQRDAVLAASEAAANAAEHAYGFDGVSLVRVEASVANGALQFSVRDEGTWREPRPQTNRGRGRTIMSALMTDVTVDFRRGGTVVRMTLPLHDEVPA